MSGIEPILYLDPQAQRPSGYCPICLGECYGPGPCLRCERRKP